MGIITINGTTYETDGNCISVINGTVTVDGKVITVLKNSGTTIKFEGNLSSLQCDKSVTVNGDITGGDVNVKGSLNCGDVRANNVKASGSINSDDVSCETLEAGGSINCDKIVHR